MSKLSFTIAVAVSRYTIKVVKPCNNVKTVHIRQLWSKKETGLSKLESPKKTETEDGRVQVQQGLPHNLEDGKANLGRISGGNVEDAADRREREGVRDSVRGCAGGCERVPQEGVQA